MCLLLYSSLGIILQDEDAHRTEAEDLNGFPENRTILNPGGCAVYDLPVDVEDEQGFVLIHPARKAGDIYENYCPKGRVEVEVSNNDQQAAFSCFLDPNDCSSHTCVGEFFSILDETTKKVELSLCVPSEETNTASIWEINISKV